jgi:hypothetical protein
MDEARRFQNTMTVQEATPSRWWCHTCEHEVSAHVNEADDVECDEVSVFSFDPWIRVVFLIIAFQL